MRALEPTSELLELARRTVWYKSPNEALLTPAHFVAHVLTYGTIADWAVLLRHLSQTDLAAALHQAPPMRLDSEMVLQILRAVENADSDAAVYLFGSRLDDVAQGGDLDLLIESKKPSLRP